MCDDVIPISVSGEVAGAYCGLCIMLRQAEVEGAVDMVTTMEKIRQQRPSIFTSKVSHGRISGRGEWEG